MTPKEKNFIEWIKAPIFSIQFKRERQRKKTIQSTRKDSSSILKRWCSIKDQPIQKSRSPATFTVKRNILSLRGITTDNIIRKITNIYWEELYWGPGLAMTDMRMQAHEPIHAIFNLYLWLLYALLIFNNWLFRHAPITYVTGARSKITHAKCCLYFFS